MAQAAGLDAGIKGADQGNHGAVVGGKQKLRDLGATPERCRNGGPDKAPSQPATPVSRVDRYRKFDLAGRLAGLSLGHAKQTAARFVDCPEQHRLRRIYPARIGHDSDIGDRRAKPGPPIRRVEGEQVALDIGQIAGVQRPHAHGPCHPQRRAARLCAGSSGQRHRYNVHHRLSLF
jgi:hypothetical protein